MLNPDFYWTISTHVTVEQKITGSSFIGRMFPVTTEDEVKKYLDQLRKKYFDATHHCYAFRIRLGQTMSEGFSDDGEPSGTAGKPILQVLKGHELENNLLVITRYFGGTKLGTGGLVRAYTETSKMTIQSTDISKIYCFVSFQIEIDYDLVTSFLRFLSNFTHEITSSTYDTHVTYSIGLIPSEIEKFKRDFIELTHGKGKLNIVNG